MRFWPLNFLGTLKSPFGVYEVASIGKGDCKREVGPLSITSFGLSLSNDRVHVLSLKPIVDKISPRRKTSVSIKSEHVMISVIGI